MADEGLRDSKFERGGQRTKGIYSVVVFEEVRNMGPIKGSFDFLNYCHIIYLDTNLNVQISI